MNESQLRLPRYPTTWRYPQLGSRLASACRGALPSPPNRIHMRRSVSPPASRYRAEIAPTPLRLVLCAALSPASLHAWIGGQACVRMTSLPSSIHHDRPTQQERLPHGICTVATTRRAATSPI